MTCIIGVGIYLAIRTGFLQIRKFGYALKCTIGRMFRKRDAADGSITPFQAVCTALAATVGTGNIAGVAGAIAIGGPGAVFWMWVSALLGMGTKFAEVTLAVHFRERNVKGDYVGGPMYYIKNGLGSKWMWLAYLYAFFGVCAVFGTGNATQVNTITADEDQRHNNADEDTDDQIAACGAGGSDQTVIDQRSIHSGSDGVDLGSIAGTENRADTKEGVQIRQPHPLAAQTVLDVVHGAANPFAVLVADRKSVV